MKTFDWEKLKLGGIAVNCKTERESDSFLKMAECCGITWHSGDSIRSHNYFKQRLSSTCYSFFNTKSWSAKGFGLVVSGIEYFRENNYTILEWSDYMEFTKEDLKVGMLVKTDHGLGIIMPTDKFNVVAYEKCRWGDVNFDCIENVWGRPVEYGDTLSFDVRFRPLLYNRSTAKEMTVGEVSKVLGYDVKIVKG